MESKLKMKEVNEIRAQIGQLKSKLSEANKRLESAGLRAIGLSTGDRIVTEKGLVQVTGCDALFSNPRPVGVKVKIDGSAGSQSAGYIDAWEKDPKP